MFISRYSISLLLQVFHHQLHQIPGLGHRGAGFDAGSLRGALYLGHGLRARQSGETPGSTERTAGDAWMNHGKTIGKQSDTGGFHGIFWDLPSGYVNRLLLKMAMYSEFSH